MKALEHDRSYGELEQLLGAYVGQDADDDARKRSVALEAYLRHTWHTRPWAVAVAERQLRELVDSPPSRIALMMGEHYRLPDLGLEDSTVHDWLTCVADHLKASVDKGEVPPPATPQTHWEWHARFPELAQFLGGWFSQDMPDEFDDHDAAVEDYRSTTHPDLVARLCGELSELVALDVGEGDYAVAVAELGMEVDPPAPYSASGWLARLAEVLGRPQGRYGTAQESS